MQVGNISLAGQRFALTRCNCSSQEKKRRKRKSKEERRAMVETFITKFRETNKGTFPSLNLTHREVGGSFYTVREIVRDIIQENRVLGPGDLDMQSLTLQDVPVSPEICENGTGAQMEKNLVRNGDLQYVEVRNADIHEAKLGLVHESEVSDESSDLLERDFLKNGDLHEEPVTEMKSVTIQKSDEMKEVIREIAHNDKISTGDLHEKSDNSEHEMKEGKSEIYQNVGKLTTGDLHEKSVMEIKIDTIENSESKMKEEKCEISLYNGKITTGDLHESEMKLKVETTEKSESEIKEKKSELSQNRDKSSTGDLHEGAKMEIEAETMKKSEFEMKEERSEISENNGKISTAETKNFENLGLGLGDSKSNDGFEMAKRTVVQVEQFPLPSKRNSVTRKDSDSDSVLAVGKKKEQELLEVQQTAGGVNSKMEIQNKTKNSISSNSSAQEKNIGAMPKTENEAVSSNSAKIKKRPINEYLMRRHESHLKLDFMTSEMISLDASINRESSKKKKEKDQANPFWVTFQAFITSVIKFWTE